MTAASEPKTKPPFLRRRWPYFVLGFLLALPTHRLAWFAFERALYGGPTTKITVVEIDAPLAGPRVTDRLVNGSQRWIRMSDGKTIVWERTRVSSPNVKIEFRYDDGSNRTSREGEATIDLAPDLHECLIQIRHGIEHTEITPCLPIVRRL